MNNLLLVSIPALYGGIQTLELSAVLARIAGLQMKRNMTGYAMQQSMYMGTRLLLVFLLPLLGFAVDTGMDQETFTLMSHLSLLSAAVLGGAVIIFRTSVVHYYCGVLQRYDGSGRYIFSFFFPDMSGLNRTNLPLSLPTRPNVLLFSTVIFTIYATGMFISFFLALVFPQFRTSISQSSGILNSIGAVLLTFVVEPAVSRSIDLEAEDAQRMVLSILIGRWIAVALTGHILLYVLYFLL